MSDLESVPTCEVCAHPDRESIDGMLASDRSSPADVATTYRVPLRVADRHAAHHVAPRESEAPALTPMMVAWMSWTSAKYLRTMAGRAENDADMANLLAMQTRHLDSTTRALAVDQERQKMLSTTASQTGLTESDISAILADPASEQARNLVDGAAAELARRRAL